MYSPATTMKRSPLGYRISHCEKVQFGHVAYVHDAEIDAWASGRPLHQALISPPRIVQLDSSKGSFCGL